MSGSSDTLRVLVIAESGCTRSLLLQALSCAFGDALSAAVVEDIATAVASINRCSWHILFIDHKVAGEWTEEHLSSLRARVPRTPIIAVMESLDEDESLALIAVGADDVVSHEDMLSDRFGKAVRRTLKRSSRAVLGQATDSEALINGNLDGFLLLDHDLSIKGLNTSFERMFAVSRKDVLGKPARLCLPSLLDGRMLCRMKAVMEGQPVLIRDLILPDAQGRPAVSVTVFLTPLRDSSGRVAGLAATIRDDSIRKRAETSLEELSVRLAALADRQKVLIWMSDGSGRRVFFNKIWRSFTGKSQEQLADDGWRNLIHHCDRDSYDSLLKSAFNEHREFRAEYRLVDSDGNYTRMIETGTPLFGRIGQFLGYMAYVSGCAEETDNQRPRTTSTLDNSPIGVIKLDTNFVITKANREVASLLGTSQSELTGKRLGDIVVSLSEATFEPVVKLGERVRLENQRIVACPELGGGEQFWDITGWSVPDEEGICLSVIDTTERQRLVQQKEDLVASLVHDLKTPLIGADRTLESILSGLNGPVDESHAKVLEVVKRSNQSLLLMVQNLIESFKYESGVPKITVESFSLHGLLSDCADELSHLFTDNKVELRLELPDDRLEVNGDRLALRRVFINLLDNALKFTGKFGRVTLASERKSNHIIVRVKDTGVGISDHDIKNLFQKFYQGDQGRVRHGSAGLGLYLCREVINVHGGNISVVSAEGAGTEFIIRLPHPGGYVDEASDGGKLSAGQTLDTSTRADGSPALIRD